MPQSFSSLLVHLIFSTKNRARSLTPEVNSALHPYLAVVLKDNNCAPVQVGGIDEHVHLLFRLSRTHTIAKMVEIVKIGSTKWLKSKSLVVGDFHWQSGYGAFSVSESAKDSVVKYILNQHEHHRKVTFQEEYRQFLDRHGIAYDEKYMWD
jgi:REP element-mobilizing transposase RayT